MGVEAEDVEAEVVEAEVVEAGHGGCRGWAWRLKLNVETEDG